MNYLDGVTSNIQTQINHKQATLTSSSEVEAEELTCTVSSKLDGSIISRTRETGAAEILKFDSSAVTDKACCVHYKSDMTDWFVGARTNDNFYRCNSGTKMEVTTNGGIMVPHDTFKSYYY